MGLRDGDLDRSRIRSPLSLLLSFSRERRLDTFLWSEGDRELRLSFDLRRLDDSGFSLKSTPSYRPALAGDLK